MAVSVGTMFVVVMPATIVRYSVRAVGIVPMGGGCLLASPLGYARSCRALAERYAGGPRGGSFDELFSSLGVEQIARSDTLAGVLSGCA